MALSAAGLLSRTAIRRWLADNAGMFILPAICVLPIIMTAPFFTEPFEGDEGVYGTMAQGILRGQVPYRDLFDHKPPLIYVWYVLSFQVFGESIIAPRLMAALAWTATTIVVYKQALLIFGRSVARSAAAAFALSSGLVLLQATSNTETFMLLPLSLSLYAFLRVLRGGGMAWLVAAGAFGAIAVFTKQVAGLSLAAGTLTLAAYGLRAWGLGATLRRVLVLSGSFLAVCLLGLVPFVLVGALDDFFYANWTYNRLYAAEEPFNLERIFTEISGLRLLLVVAGPFVLLSILGLLTTLRDHAWDGLLLGGWLLALYGGILLSGRAFPHYYVSLLAVLAVLAPQGLMALKTPSGTSRVFVGIVGIAAVISLMVNLNVYLQPTPEEKHSIRFARTYPEFQNKAPEVAAFLRSVSEPGDRIYNYGRESQVYFYADRAPGSRFMYNRSFSLDPRTIDETIRELRLTRPVVIFDSVGPRSDIAPKDVHPESLVRLLAEEYTYVGQVEFADIYLLKQD